MNLGTLGIQTHCHLLGTPNWECQRLLVCPFSRQRQSFDSSSDWNRQSFFKIPLPVERHLHDQRFLIHLQRGGSYHSETVVVAIWGLDFSKAAWTFLLVAIWLHSSWQCSHNAALHSDKCADFLLGLSRFEQWQRLSETKIFCYISMIINV